MTSRKQQQQNIDWFEEIKTLLRETPYKVKDKPFEVIWSTSDKELMTKIYK